MNNSWDMWKVLALNPGKDRRDMIVAMLESGLHRLYVNCKYRPQLYQDSDLKYLIKKKILKLVREYSHSWSGGHRRSYLVLNKEYK